jgi:hypothetical protein
MLCMYNLSFDRHYAHAINFGGILLTILKSIKPSINLKFKNADTCVANSLSNTALNVVTQAMEK